MVSLISLCYLFVIMSLENRIIVYFHDIFTHFFFIEYCFVNVEFFILDYGWQQHTAYLPYGIWSDTMVTFKIEHV